MNFLFFIFLFIITINGVTATGFSPTSLIFDLKPNEKSCQTITISSNSSEISVSDKWAENKDIDWSVGLFESSASSHGISINYDPELSINEREVEVCLSGSNLGEYHGVILLNEKQEGKSVIRMGVWLKATISNQEK